MGGLGSRLLAPFFLFFFGVDGGHFRDLLMHVFVVFFFFFFFGGGGPQQKYILES